MRIVVNPIYKPVFTTKCRYIHLWGGRARGASHFATDYFLHLITCPSYFRGGFVRSTFGEVKKSLYRAFKDRAAKADADGEVNINDFSFNETELTITYRPTGNTIISKGLKKTNNSQAANLKGLEGLTHLIIEEAEDSDEEDINKLDDTLRTVLVENIQILFLFNPPSKNHYLIQRYYDLMEADACDIKGNKIDGWYKAQPKNIPELLSIHSSYHDNLKNVHPSTEKNYNAYGDPDSPKYNPDFYCRNVLGLVSEGAKGRIFTKVKHISYQTFKELPYPSFYGLDFGFNDPVALAEHKYHNGRLFSHQHIYKPGLDNDELAQRMQAAGIAKSGTGRRKIYADCAEPKSIKTLNKMGFIVLPAEKGADSILHGIRELQNIEWFITSESQEFWTEIEEYRWDTDAEKNLIDTPIDNFNHLIDGTRYAYTMHVKKRTISTGGTTSTNDWEQWLDEPDHNQQIGPEIVPELDDEDIEAFYRSE